MHASLPKKSPFARVTTAVAALAISGLLFTSCATTSTSEPDPSRQAETTETEAEFYTLGTFGEADDYWLYFENENDIEYSYYLDETHYVFIVGDDRDDDDDGKMKKWKRRVKRGHGYGDHNHIHIHWKNRSNHPDRRHVHIKVRRQHWADSLKLTHEQKLAIDTAMREFKLCAKSSLDSFKVLFKPLRDEFRLAKLDILAKLDSGVITRDSAYVMLDSAIVLYEAKTEILRTSLKTELRACLVELDAFMQTRLTAEQYAIWVRNRGWTV
jgi:hypothetical protein